MIRSFSRILFVLAWACALAAPALAAADNPWNGTWKPNPDKMKVSGVTQTMKDDGSGAYSYSSGSASYKMNCNGAEYSAVADRMETCTMKGGDAYDIVSKINGTTVSIAHHEVSSDGKTQTVTGTVMRADGSKYNVNQTWMRVGTGKGIAGTWKETKESNENTSPMVLKVEGDMLHREFPQGKSHSDSKLDGTPVHPEGPLVAKGLMWGVKAEGKNKLMAKSTMDGKPWGEGIWTLSSDGKMITMVTWSAAKPMEKVTVVYDKQ